MSISYRGIDATNRKIQAIEDALKPVKGTVYSAGAYGPSGRYDHFVQSGPDQAAVHAGRWQTDADAKGDNEAAVYAEFQKEVQTIIRSGRGDLEAAMGRALKLLKDFMQESPPAPANSRYVRTFQLRDSYVSQVL